MPDHPPYHPFDYFGLRVTRDVGEISKHIRAKYELAKKFENTAPEKYHLFGRNVLLIATKDNRTAGTFNPEPKLFEPIVQVCLKELEDWFAPMVHPESKTVHPDQIKLTITRCNVLRLDETLAQQHLDQYIKANKIIISVDVPPPKPPPPPQPVTNLRFELLDQGPLIRWDKPADKCDYVLIRRSDWPTGKTEPIPGNAWTDETTAPGQRYEYELSSVYTGSKPGGTNRISLVARGCIESFSVAPELDEVKLSWRVPANVLGITVYRSSKAIDVTFDAAGAARVSPDAVPHGLAATTDQYVDRQVKRGATYYYCVVARHPHGVCSASPCFPVTITPNPLPPGESEVRMQSYPGRIYLSWPPSAGAGAKYRIERRESSDFGGPADAKRWETHSCTLEDKDVEPGASYWYAIRAERDGLVSLQPTIVGPELALAEVSELRVQTRSETVALTWTAPKRAKRIDVRRSQGRVPIAVSAAAADATCTTLNPSAPGKLVDAGLVNGMTYGYRISCVYAYPDGREVVTIGECVTAVPCEVPTQVRNISIALINGEIKLVWENPGRTTGHVLRTKKACLGPLGAVVPLAQLGELGAALRHVSATEAIDSQPSSSEPYYLILSGNPFQAVYCGQALFVDVPKVEVHAKRDSVSLDWVWLPGADRIEIVHEPPPTNAAGEKTGPRNHVVSRDGPKGQAIFSACRPGRHRFQVRCMAAGDSVPAAVAPARVLEVSVGAATWVRWELVRPKLLGFIPSGAKRAHKLRIITNGITPPVRLRLVGKLSQMPSRIDDGKMLAELTLPAADESQTSFEIDLLPWPGERANDVLCRLFFETDTALDIQAPNMEHRRL